MTSSPSSSKASRALPSLPKDVVRYVAQFLDIDDVATLAGVSRGFSNALTNRPWFLSRIQQIIRKIQEKEQIGILVDTIAMNNNNGVANANADAAMRRNGLTGIFKKLFEEFPAIKLVRMLSITNSEDIFASESSFLINLLSLWDEHTFTTISGQPYTNEGFNKLTGSTLSNEIPPTAANQATKASPRQERIMLILRIWSQVTMEFNYINHDVRDLIANFVAYASIQRAKPILQFLSHSDDQRNELTVKAITLFGPKSQVDSTKMELTSIPCKDLAEHLTEQDALLVEILRAQDFDPKMSITTLPNSFIPFLPQRTNAFLILRINKFVQWVAWSIVSTTDFRKRVKKYEYFIHLCKMFVDIGNFSQGMFVNSALNMTAIHKLCHTKQAISAKTQKVYDEVQKLFSPSQSYKTLREAQRTTGRCVPYFGMLMTDLVFIRDGNRDIEEETLEWNWAKISLLARTFEEIHAYQPCRYNFKVKQEIIQALNAQIFDAEMIREDTIWQQALGLEPRGFVPK